MQFKRDDLNYWVGLMDKILPSTKLVDNIHRSVQIGVGEGDQGRLRSNSDFHALEVSGLSIEGDPIDVVVEAKGLFYASGGLNESVDLILDSNEASLLVRSGKSNFTLAPEDTSLFVFPSDVKDDEFVSHGFIPKGDLVRLLENAIPFLSSEYATPHLMGVLFRGEYVYATDMAHGVRFKGDGFTFPTESNINFIPDAVVEVLKSGGEANTPVKISSNSEWVGFCVGPVKIFTRRWSLKGEYKTESTDAELQLSSQNKAKIKLNSASLREGLNRIGFFVEERLIALEASRSGIKLSAFRRDKVSASVPIEGVCNLAESRKFLLDVHHLQSFLSTDMETIEFKVGSPEDTLYCQSGYAEYIMIPAVLEDS